MAEGKRKFFRILAREERLDIITPIIKEAKKKKSEKRTPTDPALWNRAKAEAKKRFKVWPSAYCVPLESQALTKDGWKDYHNIKKGEDILAFDMESQELKWTELEDIHFYSNTPTFNLFNSDRSLNITCTPNHKWPVFNGEFKQLIETRNLLREGSFKGVRSLKLENEISWVPEIIFLSNITVIEGYNKDVWCPQTKYKTWVMKQGDKIIITGNSSGWAAKWYKEKGGGWRGKKPIK